MRLLYWLLIAIPLAVVAVLLAISYRQPVAIEMWPLPYVAEMPAYLLALATFAVGFLAGGLILWFGAIRTRRRLTRAVRVIAEQDREIADLRARTAGRSAGPYSQQAATPTQRPALSGRVPVAAPAASSAPSPASAPAPAESARPATG